MITFDSIEQAIADIRAGKPVVVVDDENRENEGDLIFAAEKATPELVAFMIRYTSGYICVGMEGEICDRLHLPAMVAHTEDPRKTAYTISVDASHGVTTGISAHDRAVTIRTLADPEATPRSLIRPGHVLPLRAVPGGVLMRAGHTEAGADLARLAGLSPAGALCEIVSEEDPTQMARALELRKWANKHGLSMISIEDLMAWRRKNEKLVERVTDAKLPTEFGEFRAYGYRSLLDNQEHLALVKGDIAAQGGEDILVRVHSECLTGDVFGSTRCDCGPQLHHSLDMINSEGRGVVLYMRGHEGRGIGLLNKLRAYHLQDEGADTVDANLKLGLPADAREYSSAAQILYDLGVRSMKLLTNNPTKREGLEGYGVAITGRALLPLDVTEENLNYLRTKRDRMGHKLEQLDEAIETVTATSAWIEHDTHRASHHN
ncbi:MAG: bifunctional 3,4-dihydroxy-2-butanone-4-phosphate synthase/GTP cyclohydrolase II [Lawsonella sp.]